MKLLALLMVVALAGCQTSGGGDPTVKCYSYIDSYGDAQTTCW